MAETMDSDGQCLLLAQPGMGFDGISFAFGLTVLTMAYAIGHISRRALNQRAMADFDAFWQLGDQPSPCIAREGNSFLNL